MKEIAPRITVDPGVAFGKPVIQGTRVPVAVVVGKLAGGMSFGEVAEEYELSHRLASRGIPVFLAPDVVALHNRQVSLAAFLRQQYGHGKGCGEASRRAPESLAVGDLRAVVERHTRTGPGALPWSLLRTAAGCRLLSRLAGAADRGWVPRRARSVAFTAAAGASFSAGVRDGLRDRPGRPQAGSRAPARRRLRSGARFARG